GPRRRDGGAGRALRQRRGAGQERQGGPRPAREGGPEGGRERGVPAGDAVRGGRRGQERPGRSAEGVQEGRQPRGRGGGREGQGTGRLLRAANATEHVMSSRLVCAALVSLLASAVPVLGAPAPTKVDEVDKLFLEAIDAYEGPKQLDE